MFALYIFAVVWFTLFGAVMLAYIWAANRCQHEGQWSEVKTRIVNSPFYNRCSDPLSAAEDGPASFHERTERYQNRYCAKCQAYQERIIS